MAEPVTTGGAGATDDQTLFFDRELSWLEFNARVLDQARDARMPPLERLKFIAIFASNLDEFFMIRVAGLHDQLESAVAAGDAATRAGILEQLARLRVRVVALSRSAKALLEGDLLPHLVRAGVRILRFADLGPEQSAWCKAHFRRAVFPVLTPLAVDPVHPFPFLSNLSISLGVEARNPDSGENGFVRIKVPERLPRFIQVGGAGHDFLALEDLIAGNLAELLPGVEVIGCHPFRLTRDMDIDILEDEASDLLAQVDRQVRQRRLGAAVRLEVPPDFPADVRRMLLERLELDEEDVYEEEGLLGLASLSAIAALPLPALRDPPLVARHAKGWGAVDPFAAIARRDVLLHHPRDSFEMVDDLLRRAAEDPDVLAIKLTLYRAGTQSEAVKSVIRAAENGKQVAVSIELKARFDEATNIQWARTFGTSGVHVFFSRAALKVHAKILLIVRREGDSIRRYVHLSTGNYNAVTSRLYTDLAIITASDEIGEDASELFNMLSGFAKPARFRRLVVAPLDLRRAVLAKIAAQAARARAGRPARIFAKMNALTDTEVIRALYAASQAGVDIDLVVRGMCCLRPAVPGLSERIRVLSLLGRFLEHERIYVFGPRDAEEMFIASADWMQRNLDRRVELMIPILDATVRDRIRAECMRPEAHEGAIYLLEPAGDYRRLDAASLAPTEPAETSSPPTARRKVAAASVSGRDPP